jgi:PST family polysaccharide transporter
MDEKAVRGVPWTMLSYAANRAATVGVTIVLARLLEPSDFGLFALATLAVSLLSIFSGLGLGAALVLRQDLGERQKGTMLTLLVGAGVVFAVILAALAPLISDVFAEPRLTELLWAIAGVLALSGMVWFYESLLQREMEFKRRFITQFGKTVLYALTALGFALAGAGVWSLIAAYVVSYVANIALLLWLSPYRVPFRWDPAFAREIFSTGGGFMLQDGASFLQQNIDYITIGRVLPASQLGFYSMAYRQSELPYYAVADPITRVTFPGFAKMRHEGQDVVPAFLRVVRLVTLAVLPLGVVLSAGAEPFTEALFGSQWTPMIAPLTVLGIWAVARPLEVTLAWFMNSIGHAAFVGRMSLALLPPLAVALFFAADRSGITAVAAVMLAHMVLGVVILMVMIRRRMGTSLRAQAGAVVPLLLAAAVSWGATRLVADALDGTAPFLALVACTAVAFAVYLAGVRIAAPGAIGDAVLQARRSLGRAPAQPVAA